MSIINKAAVLNPFSNLATSILDYIPRATTSEFGIVAIGSGINVDILGRIYLDTQEYSDRLTAIEAQAASTLATQKSEVAAAIAQANLTQSQAITALTLEVNNLKTNLTNSITATQTELITRADQLAQDVTDITVQLTQDKATFTQDIQDALDSLKDDASVASALRTPRKIQGVDFDGTKDISLPTFTTQTDGLVPKRVGATSTKYLREDGTWVEVKTKSLPATAITTASTQNQQEINDFGGAKWYAKVGGYEIGATVKLENGDIVKSTVANNTVDPNVDMTGWVKTNSASQIFDESGRTQQAINNDFINVKTYGAIGDNTLHTVQEWTTIGSRIYYPNLAAIQVDYPHVTSLTDSIDWAAIQKALDTGRNVVGPSAHYHINKSLYIKNTHQHFKDLGFIRMDAGLAKPCLYLGAKDTNGTKSDVQVWFAEISGTSFYGHNNRSEGSAGLSLVSCSQCKISIDARGFHAGIRVDGVCVVNTFYQPILLQNTYGIYDPLGDPATSDIQGTAVFGGRIEQNEREGVYSASPNIKFIGTCIEGNGKFNGSDGTAPEVTILRGPTSGAVSFSDCYMESLDGKPAPGTIVIAPLASRSVKVTSGDYFGGVANKDHIVMVEISAPASPEVSVTIIGASLSGYKNYGRGTIVGNSQFNAIGCTTKDPLALWLNVLDGGTSGRPLIFQSDRNYYYSNQDHRIRQITASGSISTTDTITATGLVTGDYFSGKSSIFGINLYKDKFTRRNRTPTAVTSSYTCIPIIDIQPTVVYIFKITAVQKLSNSAGRSFEANLLVAGNGGSPILLNSQVLWNTNPELVPSFSIDGTGVVVSNLSAAGLYDFEVTKFGRS